MALLLFTILLVSGLCILSSSVQHQFHVVKEEKSWREAQQYCREEFTDLATIDNMTEMEKVKNMTRDAGDEPGVWIGLNNGCSPKWQWSLADRDFYRENETKFRNWDENQPNLKDEKCVLMIDKGTWHDANCSKINHFICYDGKKSTEPYVLITEQKNWADAQRYCREKHTDLASVRNQTENDKIKRLNGGRNVWIGLFRDAWEWSDGSNSSFRHWDTREPNYGNGEFCAEIKHTSFWWNDINCDSPKPFICYEDKLVLVRENKTWHEALQYCREHHEDLVSVTSERVQRWVNERAKGASTAHMWVGLVHSYGVGWFWVCGQTVCYTNWTLGHDQVGSFQKVGAVSREGLWVSNLTKTNRLNFICTNMEQCD